MTLVRSMLAALTVFAASAGASTDANAQDAAPAVLAEAKRIYLEGKKLFEAKKFADAADKFLIAHRLWANPAFLFNIAVARDEAGQKDPALFYYRKFLAEAPADSAQRPDAAARVVTLEKELGPTAGRVDPAAGAGGPSSGPSPGPAPTTTTSPAAGVPATDAPPATAGPTKPSGTYAAKDFQHQAVDEAPPGKPLDITAAIPRDSGWNVTLYYRSAGDDAFTPVTMKWRYNDLVARIPAAKMKGTSVQYYVEVKDNAGSVVTKVAKASSPNLIYLEAAAPERFFPDWSDAPATEPSPAKQNPTAGGDDDNPLTGNPSPPVRLDPGDPEPRDGWGASPMLRWGATGAAAAFLGTSIVFYFRASNAANTLEEEAKLSATESCPRGNPCREFDAFLADVQSTGETAQTISRVTLGLGVVASGAAGYLWWKSLRGRASTQSAAANWSVAPILAGGPADAGTVLGASAQGAF